MAPAVLPPDALVREELARLCLLALAAAGRQLERAAEGEAMDRLAQAVNNVTAITSGKTPSSIDAVHGQP